MHFLQKGHPKAGARSPQASLRNRRQDGSVLLRVRVMDKTLTSTPFELAGSFGGFVFTDTGKRRMLLRQDAGNCLLKVPRILRRRIIGKFRSGEPIRVAGVEEMDAETGLLKRTVSQVLPDRAECSAPPSSPASPTPITACPIRVCAKKNCWRNSGRELWEALGRELDARGLADQIELRQVGCLDRCRHAPNANWGSHEYTRCTPAHASAIIARVAGNSLRR
jgi:hypothetical protein